MSHESMMPSNHLILCCPLLLMLLIFSSIRVFSDELTVHFRWPNYWKFSFSISLSKEYSGLILDWLLDWLVWSCSPRDCQESSPAPSILWCSAFFCTSLEAQLVKKPPAMWETWVQSLGWKISCRRERWPTPVFWPRDFYELCSPWGRKELDMTERLSLSLPSLLSSSRIHTWLLQRPEPWLFGPCWQSDVFAS